MINEYYIIAEAASIKPMVQVYLDNKQLFLPLVTFGIKEHAIINVQNKMHTGVIHNGQVQRLSLKGDTKSTIRLDQLSLI